MPVYQWDYRKQLWGVPAAVSGPAMEEWLWCTGRRLHWYVRSITSFPSCIQIVSIAAIPECECNGHSSACHYDPDVAMVTGGSGGVCDGCTDNTAGGQCEQCQQGFYRNPSALVTGQDTCLGE